MAATPGAPRPGGTRPWALLAAALAVVVLPMPAPPVTAGVPVAAPQAAAAPTTPVPAGAATGPSPGTYTGLGFDACTAPSSEQMQAWLASPYRAVGIYFGGVNRACQQPHLTAHWVAGQQAQGWHLMPLYVGLQAPCTTSSKRHKIDPARAAVQGRASAEDAAARAQNLGLARDSVLIFDMEAYRTGDAACRTAVLAFMSAWTARLHDLGYLSGFYSSMASGVADQVASYPTAGYVRPDYVDFARWDRAVTVADPAIPAGYWSPRRRIKQYRGDHRETHGGVTINIDNDYLDVAPLPATARADFDASGWSDLVSRDTTGRLALHTGNGTTLNAAVPLAGGGWNAMNALIRAGDVTGDGREDMITREKSTGHLWLYPGSGTALATRSRIGTNWNTMREITAIGDVDRDGRNDLLAVRTSDGRLYLYPGRAGSLGAPVVVGSGGWNSMDELTGVGDVDRDGRPDLVARVKSTGELYLYRGQGNRFAPRIRIGTGWKTMRDLAGVGDFDRDGHPDLVAVEKSTNHLFRYPGRGTALAGRIRMATGWANRTPLP